MSTFLELCQDLHREVGGAGSAPSAVTGQVGQSLRTVNWIKNAWIKIQNKHANWRWMRKAFTITWTGGYNELSYASMTDVETGAAISRFARWLPVIDNDDAFKVYDFSAGIATQTRLQYRDWEDFSHVWRIGSNISETGYPIFCSVTPGNKLALGPYPGVLDAYIVTGDYQRSAQVLAANGDEPEMPGRFHELIVWEAMRRYARFVAAPEVWADAKNEAASMMRALEVDQLPEPKFAPPLA